MVYAPYTPFQGFLTNIFNLKIPVPDFIKNNDAWIMGIGFISILFLEGYTHMAYSVNKTAYLMFSILFAAIIVDFIFEKSAWCRHLCPLGGMAGLFSMSSMIEIRSNRNVCTTICTTHDCFKGSEKADPCPMFLHLQFLSDNRNCKVCLNCIKKLHTPCDTIKPPNTRSRNRFVKTAFFGRSNYVDCSLRFVGGRNTF